MNPRILMMIVFVLLMVLAVSFFSRMKQGAAPDPVVLDSIDLGGDRVIRITVEPNSQRTLSLHYHVEVGGQPVIDHAFFGTLPRTSPPPEFITYLAENGDLVGLAQAVAPNRIIILHDFATGDSFPYRTETYKDIDTRKSYPYYEEEGSILARGEALFDRLQEDNIGLSLDLLKTMSSRPLSLPAAATPPE